MRKTVVAILLFIFILGIASSAKEIVVMSTADSGNGTLRWALQTAHSGDVITFDPKVFPPDDPATIYPRSELPHITQGHITVDASDAGVILDGSRVMGDWVGGLEIGSDRNTIRGLQVISFSGTGIAISGGRYNMVGGDRSIGRGPTGQGNLVCGNDMGIGMWGEGTSYNTLIGNEMIENRSHGVWITEGAHDNTVGPGNEITSNEGYGVLIEWAGSVRNVVTSNRIHGNGTGIGLQSGGNDALRPPVLASFNLASGQAAGWSCPNCTVEVFSDTAAQGTWFEGTAIADGEGWFTIDIAGPPHGPRITATATDPERGTSPFSVPMSGSGRDLVVQGENTGEKRLLVTKRSEELPDNRIGGMWNGFWQPVDLVSIVENQILGLGLKRARLTINSTEQVTAGKQAADMAKPEMSVIPHHDEIFSTVAAHGVEITYTLTFWDKESPYTEVVLSGPRFKSEDQILRYLDFVRFIVGHFKDRVQCFEIWNEPNQPDPGHHIDVWDYIELVRRTVPVIRDEFPQAKIQVGGTSNLREPEPRDYLFRILRSNIMPLVDVVSWHPIYGTSPEHEYYEEYYYDYPPLVQEIKNVASSHGFKGEYVADELTYWVQGELIGWEGEPWRYSPTRAAKFYARAIVMHLGMDVTVGVGGISERPIIFPTIQNLCTLMAAHEAIGMPVEIDVDYEPVAYCAFRYPNGDRILAVWTDGVAQDEDSGVPATITFPGLTTETVTGIDVLHGFEQELVFETAGGKTVIRDLLVKDYPILIKLSGVMMGPDYEETPGDGFHRVGEPPKADRDGDGVPDEVDYCPDWPGDPSKNGC